MTIAVGHEAEFFAMTLQYPPDSQSYPFFSGSSFIPCAVHPKGVKERHCLDWRPIESSDEETSFYSPPEQ